MNLICTGKPTTLFRLKDIESNYSFSIHRLVQLSDHITDVSFVQWILINEEETSN